MKKALLFSLGLVAMATVVAPMYGQGGCLNSPENPTVVLALVGTAGAFTASLRTRLRARGKSIQK